MQYFIKVKFRRLLAVIGHCRAWIDCKIRKHYSTRFEHYCILSTNHRESIYFTIRCSVIGTTPQDINCEADLKIGLVRTLQQSWKTGCQTFTFIISNIFILVSVCLCRHVYPNMDQETIPAGVTGLCFSVKVVQWGVAGNHQNDFVSLAVCSQFSHRSLQIFFNGVER